MMSRLDVHASFSHMRTGTVTHKSFLNVPFASGSKTLNALRMVSSGSAPEDEQMKSSKKGNTFIFPFLNYYNGALEHAEQTPLFTF